MTHRLTTASFPVEDNERDRVRRDEREVVVEQETESVARDLQHDTTVSGEVVKVVEVDDGLRCSGVRLSGRMFD